MLISSLVNIVFSGAALCVQPNITWHPYDVAWSAQREGVNQQQSCLCITAEQITLFLGFFHHTGTTAAIPIIHWVTAWGFPVLGAYHRNECIMQSGIPLPYENSTNATGAMNLFPGLVILSRMCRGHAFLEKLSNPIQRWVHFKYIISFPHKNTSKLFIWLRGRYWCFLNVKVINFSICAQRFDSGTYRAMELCRVYAGK